MSRELEIERVKTCLDEIAQKQDVSNQDLARAMQSFVGDCYLRHLSITKDNAQKIEEIRSAIHPIVEYIKPKIDNEKTWREAKTKVIIHVAQWAFVIFIAWVFLVFGEGIKGLVLKWLNG